MLDHRGGYRDAAAPIVAAGSSDEAPSDDGIAARDQLVSRIGWSAAFPILIILRVVVPVALSPRAESFVLGSLVVIVAIVLLTALRVLLLKRIPTVLVRGTVSHARGRFRFVDDRGRRHRIAVSRWAAEPRLRPGRAIARVHPVDRAVLAIRAVPLDVDHEHIAIQSAIDAHFGTSPADRDALAQRRVPAHLRWRVVAFRANVCEATGMLRSLPPGPPHRIVVGSDVFDDRAAHREVVRDGDIVRAFHANGVLLAIELIALCPFSSSPASWRRVIERSYDEEMHELRARFR